MLEDGRTLFDYNIQKDFVPFLLANFSLFSASSLKMEECCPTSTQNVFAKWLVSVLAHRRQHNSWSVCILVVRPTPFTVAAFIRSTSARTVMNIVTVPYWNRGKSALLVLSASIFGRAFGSLCQASRSVASMLGLTFSTNSSFVMRVCTPTLHSFSAATCSVVLTRHH